MRIPTCPELLCWTMVSLLVGCGGDDQADPIASATETTGTDATGADATDTDDSGPATGSTGADTAGGNFNPVVLDCPAPGALPFTTQSDSFESSEAQDLVSTLPRNKDEASDLLGNPGGNVGYTTMGNDEQTATGLQIFVGRKARTAPDMGLVQQFIPAGEWVSLWGYDGVQWSELARAMTNMSGGYQFDGVDLSANRLQPHYAILEGDQSCSAHYQFLLPPEAQVIVSDIDGTLTLADEEFTMQIGDGSYDPLQKGAASELLNVWDDKGYTIVYLTARPHAFRAETRAWLRAHDYPVGPVITANTLVMGDTARTYKGTWVSRLRDDFSWEVVAAYGNAESDIDAYADAGVATDITFIIGEHAGASGTQAIDNDDYTDHIAEFVEPYPDAEPLD